MVATPKKQFEPLKPFKEQQLNKSKGIFEDHVVRKNIHTREGTITRNPVSEIDIVNKGYVDSVAGRSSLDLFVTEDSSDIGTYFDLVVNVDTSAKQNIVQSITANSTTLIGSFASVLNDAEVNAIELLESGIYDLHIHAEGAAAKNLFLYFEFYHRTAGGTETPLGTSHDSGELTTSEAGYELHAVITTDQAFVPGDRIVIKIYGRNNSAAARNVTIYMEGDTAARAEFPGIIPPTFVAAHVSTHETGGTDAISHDSIDDVSADDHHAESHAHTHASTTGRTTDDHHAQTHTIVSHDITATGAEIDTHIGLTNEHLDWTADQGGTDIHAGNYTDTTYISSDFTHDDLVSGTIADHDTGATGAELDTLTDTSDADGLHAHATNDAKVSYTKTNVKGHVAHGATAGTARATGFTSVEWVGSVEPTNAVNGDTWIDTT